jgi:predicted esterase
VIEVGFARRARELLVGAGFDVDYRESDVTHTIDPPDLERAARWLAATVADR